MLPRMRALSIALVAVALAATARESASQDPTPPPPPEATEVWAPIPPVVTPGPVGLAGAPPSDAVVLFDGGDLAEWVDVADGSPAGWPVDGGVFTVDKTVGDIETRRRFDSYQLHLEWRVPAHVIGEGQARGNSGVFLAWDPERRGGYELQILDSWENATYVNGMAGSLYKQAIPAVNASRPPGEWQSYDVVWTAPRFADDGTLVRPARATVFHNGVLVQNDVVLDGDTVYRGAPAYHPHGPLPLMLQAHGDPSPPVSFRNIWLREIG